MTREEEAKRQARLVDQLASMHSILRDRAESRSDFFGLVIICASFALIVASIATDDVIRGFGLDPTSARRWATLLAIALFGLSLVELRLGYGLRAAGHREAAQRLFQLKQRYRAELSGAPSPTRLAKLADEYEFVCSVLPPIPEKQFHSLKMAHLRKVQLSKLIDLYPHVPLVVLRARLKWEAIRGRKPAA